MFPLSLNIANVEHIQQIANSKPLEVDEITYKHLKR